MRLPGKTWRMFKWQRFLRWGSTSSLGTVYSCTITTMRGTTCQAKVRPLRFRISDKSTRSSSFDCCYMQEFKVSWWRSGGIIVRGTELLAPRRQRSSPMTSSPRTNRQPSTSSATYRKPIQLAICWLELTCKGSPPHLHHRLPKMSDDRAASSNEEFILVATVTVFWKLHERIHESNYFTLRYWSIK